MNCRKKEENHYLFKGCGSQAGLWLQEEARSAGENKLASSKLRFSETITDSLAHWLTGVKSRATSVAKKFFWPGNRSWKLLHGAIEGDVLEDFEPGEEHIHCKNIVLHLGPIGKGGEVPM